jgi:hypothetical protein
MELSMDSQIAIGETKSRDHRQYSDRKRNWLEHQDSDLFRATVPPIMMSAIAFTSILKA